jgi:hypothetical protein
VLAGVSLVAGLTACAVGGTAVSTKGTTTWAVTVGGTLGAIAFLAALVTLVTGNYITLAVLIGITVGLWLMSTLRHTFTRPRHLSGAAEGRALR